MVLFMDDTISLLMAVFLRSEKAQIQLPMHQNCTKQFSCGRVTSVTFNSKINLAVPVAYEPKMLDIEIYAVGVCLPKKAFN